MELKHTPRPWNVGRGTGLLNQVAIDPSIGCAYGAGDEVKANARLMAAAPELLEALSNVMSWIQNWSPEFTHDNEWPSDRDAALDAIAKALGEEADQDDTEDEICCHACNGSGEGMTDGSTCSSCKGRGELSTRGGSA